MKQNVLATAPPTHSANWIFQMFICFRVKSLKICLPEEKALLGRSAGLGLERHDLQ